MAKINVHIHADPGPNNSVIYTHSLGSGPTGDQPIKLNKGSGGDDLIFNIVDKTTLDLRFPQTNQFLAEVTIGDACPTILDTTQFTISPTSTTKKLIVHDRNDGDPRTFHYQVNIEDAAGRQHPYDPVIQNGGGSKKNTVLIVVVVVVAVAAVGAIAAYALGLWTF